MKGFDQQITPGFQVIYGELQYEIAQILAARCVGGVDSAQIRRHIRNDQVGRPALQGFDETALDGFLTKIALDRLHPLDRLDRQQVQSDHPPAQTPRTVRQALNDHLGPTARRGPQLHHRRRGPDQPIAVVDLDQLVGCARAVTVAGSRLYVRVGQVPLDPGPVGAVLASGAILCLHLVRSKRSCGTLSPSPSP